MRRRVRLPRRPSTFFAVLVLAGATTSPVAGQPEAIELQLKYERGETLYYHSVSSTQASREVSTWLWDTQWAVATTEEGRLALRVFDVDPEGTMAVESVIEDVRATADGRAVDWVDEPATFKIRPDGEIVEVQGGEKLSMALAFASRFPGRPLRVGDSWSTPYSTRIFGTTVDATATSTLVGVDRTDAGRTARVRTRVEGTVKGVSRPRREEPQVQITGTVRGSEDEVWSVERGRVLQRTSESTVDLHMTQTERGQTVRTNVTIHSAERIIALPRDHVVVAAVGPDSLIAPGKAVGGFALGQRMDELVNKLGPPGPDGSAPDGTMWGVDRGFRSMPASWPNGLVAYVDPQDRSAVLGLGVAGRRYRTDKGLGFGSSRGAVLFAHGTPPTRLTMKSPSSAAVLILVYNDEGIAYAIAAEDQPSRSIRSPVPFGAVRWIVVFPPGSAGRIFPQP